MFEMNDVSTGYGHVPILRGLDLTIGDGEIIAIGGPNGAGKSTLLKAIAGVLGPWSGKVTFAGKDISSLSAADRAESGIVLCPEGRRIFTSLTIEENLKIGATVMRRSLGAAFPAYMRDEIDTIFSIFPVLGERRGRMGGALSGGQQQMLAIGRALMARPKLLLLDEPSLGLSPKIADEVYGVLASLKEKGLSMVVVEEAAGRPLELADRGMLMRRGAIVRQAPAADLLASTDFAADYMGHTA
jgi:branched-chain amino acid transport system ATP-binding protein